MSAMPMSTEDVRVPSLTGFRHVNDETIGRCWPRSAFRAWIGCYMAAVICIRPWIAYRNVFKLGDELRKTVLFDQEMPSRDNARKIP